MPAETATHPSVPATPRAPPAPARATIAYLNSEYPSLSHTFIEREIRALRALGFSIQPFSVRPSGHHGAAGTAHEEAARETVYILGNKPRLLRSTLAAVISSPTGALRALIASQRLAPPGLASRLRHIAYTIEAMRLAVQLRKRSIRHIHVHMANAGAVVALLATKFDPRLEYSLTIHGSAEFFHVDTWTLAPKAEGARFVRCISDFCRAQVMTWTRPGAWPDFHIVHCGIDETVYAPKPPREPGPLRLLAVGRLHPIKGYHILFEACALLSDRGVDWTLDLVGDGPMRAALETAARNLKLGDRVRFSGAVSQDAIGDHFDAADALVVSSFMEGVPVVLMEAMAKELAVVSTKVGGVHELVEDGVSGLLVSAGSARGLADGLTRFAADPALMARMGRAGRAAVLEGFTIRGSARGMAELFERYGVSLRRTDE